MATLGQLKSRIASELNRTDLTSAIANEIPRVIERYASRRFWFLEGVRTSSTTAGSSTSTGSSGPRTIDRLLITIGSGKSELCPRSLAEITELVGFNASQGQPTDYAYTDNTLTFYPTPDATYTLTAIGIFPEAAFADDSSSNAWTTEAEDLICYDVTERLARTKLRNVALADQARGLRDEALRELRAETARRISGTIQSSF